MERQTGTRRQLARGLVAPSVLLVAACGTAGESSETGAGGTPAAITTPVTIDVAWEQTTNDMGQFVTGPARELFQQRHPGVTVNFIALGNSREKVLAQAAAGTPPHVLHLAVDLPAFYASQNMLLSLDALLQKDRDVRKADFVPNLWEAFTVKGKQYGLPREAGPTVLYYNKSHLAGSGAPTPAESWTLANEYRDAAVKLTKPGDPPVIGTELGNWRNWVWSNGGDLIDSSLTKYVLDQGPAVEGLQLFQDFRYRHMCSTTPQDQSALASIQRFIRGGLGLFPGTRSAGNTTGFLQPHVGIAQHPKGKAGRKFTMPGNGYALLQPNKAPEASWEVAKWYVSPEFQKMHYKLNMGGVVARTAVLQSEEYLGSSIPKEWNEFFAKGVADLKVPPKLSNWPEIDAAINEELRGFQNGTETATAATTRMAPMITALLNQAVGR